MSRVIRVRQVISLRGCRSIIRRDRLSYRIIGALIELVVIEACIVDARPVATDIDPAKTGLVRIIRRKRRRDIARADRCNLM